MGFLSAEIELFLMGLVDVGTSFSSDTTSESSLLGDREEEDSGRGFLEGEEEGDGRDLLLGLSGVLSMSFFFDGDFDRLAVLLV